LEAVLGKDKIDRKRGATLPWATGDRAAGEQGIPSAGAAALDADVLIAAQAQEVGGTVVTNNPGHIGRWVPVRIWL
jgi:hypothetical protein